ncbi:MAG: hypothetical protein K2Y71_18680 [Xanthobacteraceae bacterium]|nr:hypothetical protein [Xanthobacteraceae bacterium]
MRLRSVIFLVAQCVVIACVVSSGKAQNRIIILKSGETVELHTVYWVSNCRSIMIGLPEIEVLEGQEHVSLSMKKDMVLPRRQECPNKVPGGVLTATAKNIEKPMEGKLTYRLKYKIKDGDRPRGYSFGLSLFP